MALIAAMALMAVITAITINSEFAKYYELSRSNGLWMAITTAI